MENKLWLKVIAALKRLPEMQKTLRRLSGKSTNAGTAMKAAGSGNDRVCDPGIANLTAEACNIALRRRLLIFGQFRGDRIVNALRKLIALFDRILRRRRSAFQIAR